MGVGIGGKEGDWGDPQGSSQGLTIQEETQSRPEHVSRKHMDLDSGAVPS